MHDLTRNRFIIFVSLIALAPLLAAPAAAVAAGSHPSPPAGTCTPFTAFQATNFGDSITIDNPFLPLVPGTQLTLEGRANSGGITLPHTVVFTVTDLVKKIDGVYTLVIWDVDATDGLKQEAELAFFAQDKAGNVWNLGEYPEEYQDGEFVGAPSTWISGEGAQGGVHMPADPQLGRPPYLQGYVPNIKFLDCAQVLAKNQTTCVPLQCYSNVLVTDETSPLDDPDAHQRKYHAPGVGIIQVGAVDDPQGETLVLTKIKHLGPNALADARAEAFKLEQRAYEVSQVYRRTEPAVQCVPSRRAATLVPRPTTTLVCP